LGLTIVASRMTAAHSTTKLHVVMMAMIGRLLDEGVPLFRMHTLTQASGTCGSPV
jgi:hypothetical protein